MPPLPPRVPKSRAGKSLSLPPPSETEPAFENSYATIVEALASKSQEKLEKDIQSAIEDSLIYQVRENTTKVNDKTLSGTSDSDTSDDKSENETNKTKINRRMQVMSQTNNSVIANDETPSTKRLSGELICLVCK